MSIEFYDIHTARISSFPSIIAGRGGNQYPRDWEAGRASGLRILHRAEPCPDGYVRDGGPRYEWTDSDCTESYDLITVAEYEARQAEQEAARIAALASEPMSDKPNSPTYGQAVGSLVQQLAVFGIALPTDPFSVMGPMDTEIDANPKKAGKAMKAMFLYQSLKIRMSDADIYAIAKILNLAE
jgi:hypothetical protein